MNKKIRWITETAVMLALLITLQWMGSLIAEPMTKQLVTGSLVNVVLAITVLFAGLNSGLTVAVISPVLAFFIGIAKPWLVPVSMVGNVVLVILLYIIAGKDSRKIVRQVLAWLTAAVAKYAAMYGVGVLLLGKLLAGPLGLAKTDIAPVIKSCTWVQLVTALIGGAVALSITPALRKALRK